VFPRQPESARTPPRCHQLFYANSQTLRDTVTEMVRSSKDTIGTVILDLDARDELDITSTEALAKLIKELAHRDVRVALAHVHATAADMIRRSAGDGKPGPDRIFPNLDSAARWASIGPASSVPRAEEE
jgi:MFS superfamily sulfate permease-like transporter